MQDNTYLFLKASVLSAIVSLLIYGLALLYVNHLEMINYYEIDFNNVLDIAESGDIVITRWHHVDLGIRVFSKFCHIGIINKNDKGELTIIELHPEETDDETGITKEGVNIYPFKERIQELNCICYFLKSKRPFNINIDNLEQYKKVKFDRSYRWNFVKYWMQNQFRWHGHKDLNYMYCSQLIGLILQDSNILHKNYPIHTLSPASFEDLYDNCGKKLYGPAYKITGIEKKEND